MTGPHDRYRSDRNVQTFGLFTLGLCLHNPSTADELADDRTVRRCIAFADALGSARLAVVNARAGRAPESANLWRVDAPIGPDNRAAIACNADGSPKPPPFRFGRRARCPEGGLALHPAALEIELASRRPTRAGARPHRSTDRRRNRVDPSGDRLAPTALYEAATALLVRSRIWFGLRAWA